MKYGGVALCRHGTGLSHGYVWNKFSAHVSGTGDADM